MIQARTEGEGRTANSNFQSFAYSPAPASLNEDWEPKFVKVFVPSMLGSKSRRSFDFRYSLPAVIGGTSDECSDTGSAIVKVRCKIRIEVLLLVHRRPVSNL
jgi:hypothetical protein